MIERKEIDGKMATLAYLKAGFEPADKFDATLVKIIFDNGEIAFMGRADAVRLSH